MKAVKIELKQAQKVKEELTRKNILDYNYKIIKEKKYIYFPLKKNVNEYKIVNKKFITKEKTKNLKEYLENRLNSREINKINNSFEIVGNVAIIELDESLEDKKNEIAEAILKVNKNVNTVAKKIGTREGIYRLLNYEIIKGNKTLETIHKENGLRFKLDLSKTYFTAKLSTERIRIAKQVKENETVLVMFSGIAIYPITISKYSKAKEIYGIEINPEACKYAEENLIINKIKNVKLYCGDVRHIVPNLPIKFDKIIMPLPKTSKEYLELAFSILNKDGVIYLYIFIDDDKFKEKIKELKQKYKIINIIKAGQTRPRSYRYCIELRL